MFCLWSLLFVKGYNKLLGLYLVIADCKYWPVWSSNTLAWSSEDWYTRNNCIETVNSKSEYSRTAVRLRAGSAQGSPCGAAQQKPRPSNLLCRPSAPSTRRSTWHCVRRRWQSQYIAQTASEITATLWRHYKPWLTRVLSIPSSES